jgi:hypothetical protein
MNLCKILDEEFSAGTLHSEWEFYERPPGDFLDWFIKNGQCFDSAKPIPEGLKLSQSTASQCFHNSQKVATENTETDYWEGIMYCPKFKEAWHHGFNVKNSMAFDVTYERNKESFIKEKGERAYIYFGIQKPAKFLNAYIETIEKSDTHHPLLLEYYNQQIAAAPRH